MADPIALAQAMVDALDRADEGKLRELVPEKYWDWVDYYLQNPSGWREIEDLAGQPRAITSTRLLAPRMARLALRGPQGDAFVTATFDERDHVSAFALDAEEYEGIGNIVITCPDERVVDLQAFYAALVGDAPRRRPRLVFDEGRGYRPPRWPDPAYPQQMHLDFRATDLGRADRLVLDNGGTLLARTADHTVYADPIGHPLCVYPCLSPGDTDGLWRVVIDCPRPAELEAFYLALLGSSPVPVVSFQEVSPYIAPRWPDPDFPAQMHFDLKIDDRAPIVERIERLGAQLLPPQGGSCPVYADPAGHPFCLCLHGE